MNEVTATLLETSFENEMVISFGEAAAELSLDSMMSRLPVLVPAEKPQRRTYDGITDPDLLVRLEARIADAEHKPGDWAQTRQSVGGICTNVEPSNTFDSGYRESQWASFSYKRDGYLAVEAVNALPELMARLRSAEAGERSADHEVDRLLTRLEMPAGYKGKLDGIATRDVTINNLRAEIQRLTDLLENSKGLGVDACDAIIDSKIKQTAAERDVLAERVRQVTEEGYGTAHDDEHACDEIAALACFFAMPPAAREWDATSSGYGATFSLAILPPGWCCKTGDRRRELVKAGALILAEIERLDRAAAAAPTELYTAAEEARMDVVGQNGNDGEHYLPVDLTWDQAPEWADHLGRVKGNSLFWFSETLNRYRYAYSGSEHSFTDGVDCRGGTHALSEVTLIATRPAPADDDWIKWDADACGPIPKDVAEIRFRDGSTMPGHHHVSWGPKSDSFRNHEVVAYRVKVADDGWIEWNPSAGLPEPEGAIYIRLRGGYEQPVSGYHVGWGVLDWGPLENHSRHREIVAYRLTDPAVKP